MLRGHWIDVEIVTFYTIIVAAIVFLAINSFMWTDLNSPSNLKKTKKYESSDNMQVDNSIEQEKKRKSCTSRFLKNIFLRLHNILFICRTDIPMLLRHKIVSSIK